MGPRGRARCRALLDAAAALFMEKGYDQTTLSDIVSRAGGSRATLYEHFGDKAGLFRAMMEEHNARFLTSLSALTISTSEPPEAALTRFGLHFLHTLMEPETAAILRTLVSEGTRIPDIAASFFRIGPDIVSSRFADDLRRLAEAGTLRIPDPEAAAHAFIGMIIGSLLLPRLVLPDAAVSDAELERHVRQAVALFLDGTRAAPGDRTG